MILLLSPNERGLLEHAGDRQPLSLTYLSGALKANGIEHQAMDLNKQSLKDVMLYLKEKKPKYVGVTYLAPTSQQMNRVLSVVKLFYPDTRLISGGVEVTNDPGKSDADIEVSGPGESQLVNILKGTNEQFDIDRYPNNRQALNEEEYDYRVEGMRATTIITSRGCPNKCVFCSVPEKRLQFRSLERIGQELAEIKGRYQAIHVYDDSFLANRERAMSVVDEFAKAGLKYRIEARAGHIPGVVEHLARTGCVKVAMGIESGNNEILRWSSKNSTTSQVEASVRTLHEHGIKTKGYFIIGLPGETEDTAKQTIQFAKKLGAYGLEADFYPLCPFSGSPIAKDPAKYGIKVLISDPTKYLTGGRELIVPTETAGLKAERIKQLILGARK